MNAVGSVRSWDIATAVDGPGTRFVLFMNGCPLRCLYCENPETWHMRDGQRMTVSEVLAEVAKYRRFIEVAGGGFTVSGGEPLLQPAFVGSLLHEVKKLGLHTAVDTSGFLGRRAPDSMLDDTDLVLLDIKSSDPALYRQVTGGEVAPTLEFARRLSVRGNAMWIRFVLVPGLTDDHANVEGIASFVSTLQTVERVEILPFHKLGAAKYTKLGMRFPLEHVPVPDGDSVERVRHQFAHHGVIARGWFSD
nr:pyruvate formate-lyase-activating protein [Kibdelosporangium sp. MJ126-NF4]